MKMKFNWPNWLFKGRSENPVKPASTAKSENTVKRENNESKEQKNSSIMRFFTRGSP